MKPLKILVILIFAITFFGCKGGMKTAPDHLIGVWKTDDSVYFDRTFEIKKEEVIFQTGENTYDTFRIKKIEVEDAPHKGATLYIIHYKILEGKVYKFSFYYSPEKTGVIRFKNQERMIWTKKS